MIRTYSISASGSYGKSSFTGFANAPVVGSADVSAIQEILPPLPEGEVANHWRSPVPPMMFTRTHAPQAPFALNVHVMQADTVDINQSVMSAPFVAQVLAQNANFEALRYLQVYEKMMGNSNVYLKSGNIALPQTSKGAVFRAQNRQKQLALSAAHANQNHDLQVQNAANDMPEVEAAEGAKTFVSLHPPALKQAFEPYPFGKSAAPALQNLPRFEPMPFFG